MSQTDVSSRSLRPIVAQCTGRYAVGKKVQREPAIIEPGMFLSTRDASPMYLPPQWSASIHPEGKIYFHRSPGLSVVTDSYMYTPSIAEQICAFASTVEKQAMDKGFVLTNDVELSLQLDGEDCSYYFIDRATKTLFWLEQHVSNDVSLHPTVSASHLKIVLEAEYWSHVEQFCMHFGGLPRKDIDDLILVFSHALADTLTSFVSTFPYDAAACERFLNLLTSSRDRIHDGYITCYVARLWGVVAYNRYETHYGQEQSRLSRDISILIDENSEPEWVQSLVSIITCRTSVPYSQRLNDLFLDSFVYGCDWNAFMTSSIRDWQIIAAQSVVLLLLQIFCLFIPMSPPLFYTSSSLATLSIFSSALLIYKHQPLANVGASLAHDYLTAVCSPHVKFQAVALAYALPKSFFLWGLLISISQAVYIICHYVSIHFAVLSGGVVFSVLLTIHFVTSGAQLRQPSFLLPPVFASNVIQDEDSMA